jgi:hypothetical protein
VTVEDAKAATENKGIEDDGYGKPVARGRLKLDDGPSLLHVSSAIFIRCVSIYEKDS